LVQTVIVIWHAIAVPNRKCRFSRPIHGWQILVALDQNAAAEVLDAFQLPSEVRRFVSQEVMKSVESRTSANVPWFKSGAEALAVQTLRVTGWVFETCGLGQTAPRMKTSACSPGLPS
jgi:hypothetical protein